MSKQLTDIQRLRLEMAVYQAADRYYVGYTGGSWKFDEEGQYWWPDVEGEVTLDNPNYGDQVMTARAAGVALSSMMANRICWRMADNEQHEKGAFWAAMFYQIRNHAINDDSKFSDSDKGAIIRFLD